MDRATDQQLSEMMEEIRSIKKTLQQKKPNLRIALHPKHLRFFMLFLGMSISVFSLSYYFLEQRNGGFGATPEIIRQVYIWLAILVGVTLLVRFAIFGSRSMWKKGRTQTIESAWDALFSFRLIHMLRPLDFLAFVLILNFLSLKMNYYVIPTLSIWLGLHFNFLGCITEIKNYIIGGYWFVLTGIAVLLFHSIPGSLAILMSLGGGSLLFGLVPTAEN